MENLRRISLEPWLYAAAFGVALLLRTLNLGAAPLPEGEASLALQALDASRGLAFTPGVQPGYVSLTGFLFFLFGSSNFLARFWPALAGALLVLSPFFFRRWLSWRAALILAFGFALDPGLVALSRQAGSPIIALSFGLLAAGMLVQRQALWAGIAAGLALLGGPSLLQGLLGLSLAWALSALLERLGLMLPFNEMSQQLEMHLSEQAPDWRKFGIALVVTLLAVGTLFGRLPQGLGAWVAALPAYIAGWAAPAAVPPLRVLAAFVIYPVLAVLFGLLGLVAGLLRRSPLVSRLGLWLLFALLLALIYPAQDASGLAWALIPLWVLAALGIDWSLPEGGQPWWASLVLALVTFIFLVLFWFNLAGLAQPYDDRMLLMRLLVTGAGLALVALVSFLEATLWSWETATRGLVWGLVGTLGLALVSSTWGATQLRPGSPQELWSPAQAVGQAGLLHRTVRDLSEYGRGQRYEIDLTIAVDSDGLRWLFRDYPAAKFIPETQSVQGLGAEGALPSIVITRQTQAAPSLAAAYRGQDFVWWVYPGWQSTLPDNVISWLAFRQAPLQEEQLVLWARADLFPGQSLAPQELDSSSQPQELQPVQEPPR